MMGENDVRARLYRETELFRPKPAMSLKAWCKLNDCNHGAVLKFIDGDQTAPACLLSAFGLEPRYVRAR